MAKITRYTGDLKAFASTAVGTERTIFGSLLQSDDLTANIVADFLRGWGILGPNDVPSREDFNAAFFVSTQLVAYLHQMGLPEWDSLQEFPQYALTNKNGVLYGSVINANIGNDPAADDGTNWLPLIDNSALTATVTPAADADVALVRDEYTAHRLKLVDGAWLSGHSIIVPTSTRIYVIDNSAGTYAAVVKTAAGTGITVQPGTSRILACDSVNVVEAENGGMLKSVYDPAGIAQQLVGINATQTMTNKTLTQPKIAIIKSAAVATPPLFGDSALREMGQLATAWVRFDASSGTPTINASFNVSSITDLGVGSNQLNFANAMNTANFAATGSSNSNLGGTSFNTFTVSSVLMETRSSAFVLTDYALVSAIISGGI